MTQKLELMGHIVAGYPTMQCCLRAGAGILRGGANFLEVQFPFSDSSADGVLIQNASDYSILHGINIQHCFTILQKLCSTSRHILAMTYANIILSFGIEAFVNKLKEYGAYGLIAPDFVFGEEDFGLRELCNKNDIYFIELVSPTTSMKRVREIALNTRAPFVYVMARNGLTGNSTELSREVLEYICAINEICRIESKSVMVGFGINNPAQIKALEGKVYGVVAGSYFVDVINKNLESEDLLNILQDATYKLLNFDKDKLDIL